MLSALCSLLSALCFIDDDTPIEFSADLISAGQVVNCKLDDYRIGRVIDFKVTIVNKLGEAIEIDRVEPSCGCTVATIDSDNKVADKAWTTAKLSLRINDPGAFEKPVLVYRKGSESPLLVLKVLGTAADPIEWRVPSSIELDSKTFAAEADMELKAAFVDVQLSAANMIVVGDFFEKLSPHNDEPNRITAKIRFQASANAAAESQHFLRVAYTDKFGKHVREYPMLVRNQPPLRAAPRKLTLVKRLDQPSDVRFALIGTFEKDKEVVIDFRFDGKRIDRLSLTPSSDRLVSVKLKIEDNSPLWDVSSGIIHVSTASESIDVPFVLQE